MAGAPTVHCIIQILKLRERPDGKQGGRKNPSTVRGRGRQCCRDAQGHHRAVCVPGAQSPRAPRVLCSGEQLGKVTVQRPGFLIRVNPAGHLTIEFTGAAARVQQDCEPETLRVKPASLPRRSSVRCSELLGGPVIGRWRVFIPPAGASQAASAKALAMVCGNVMATNHLAG